MVIGYYGVILPEKKLWQGFFLEDMFKEASDEYLDMMRKDRALGEVPSFAAAGGPIPPFEGFVAALGAGIARMIDPSMKPDLASISIMAMAFSRLMGLRYFILISESDPRGGAMTQLEDMPNARTTEDGRNAFGRHPLILRFKREITEREFARFHMDKAGHA